MRNGFSFVEVLASIAILSFMGLALLKFNAFNKRAMERNIIKQENTLLTSAVLYEKDININDNKDIELLELVTFNKLHDKDRDFLRSVELNIVKNLEESLMLGGIAPMDLSTDSDLNMQEQGIVEEELSQTDELNIEYGTLEVTYKEYTQHYLWAQKEQ